MEDMMDKSELIALADRVAEADGQDRELDALIWCAIHGKRYKGHNQAYGSCKTQVEFTSPPKRRREVSGVFGLPHALEWTKSLDAAITLVPEGMVFELTTWLGDDCEAKVCEFNPGEMPIGSAFAATPALAMAAASLRARAERMAPE